MLADKPAQHDSAGRRPGTICFVTNEIDGLFKNGGIATYFYLNATLLARCGWTVHVLYTTPIDDEDVRAEFVAKLKKLGITFHMLDLIPDPGSETEHTVRTPWYLERGDHIRLVLRDLQAQYHYDLIEFSEYLGAGFRTLQAKNAGTDFQDVDIIVRAHSSNQWLREGNLNWVTDRNDAMLDYAERYAFENADIQVAPSAYMLGYMKQVGWKVRDDARASTNPFPDPVRKTVAIAAKDATPELVFYGRLEVRKGLELFLDAVKTLPDDVPVTFLGRSVPIGRGEKTSEDLIAERLGDRPVKLITDYGRDQALEYMTTGNRVAVMGSLADNQPYTVVECIVNRIPFIASAVGGVPEMIHDPAARQHLMFEPNAKALRKCLGDYLALPAKTRQELHAAVSDHPMVRNNHETVLTQYAEWAAASRKKKTEGINPSARKGKDEPLVSVAIPYYNLGEFLPETLASLAAQTYRNFEVIVVNDGSTDPSSIKVMEAMARKYPDFRFITQVNGGIGRARNKGLAEARGEFFIPVDADNIAHPQMIEVFVSAITHRTDVAALACYYKAFSNTPDIDAGKYPYFYRPTGGPHYLAAIDNVYGDANGIYRTDVLRSIGGYETDRTTSWEDWELYVKLVNAGYKTDVLPEYLFYYRHREESWMRVTSEWKNHRRVLRQYFQPVPLSTAESLGLWTLLVSQARRQPYLENRLHKAEHELELIRAGAHRLRLDLEAAQNSKAYRISHKINRVLSMAPVLKTVIKAPIRLLIDGPRAVIGAIRSPLKLPVPSRKISA